MEKLISIIIPTFNRKEYLNQTIEAFKNQVIRNSEKVELIICDNASEDGTQKLLEGYVQTQHFFDYRLYKDRVYVKQSFERSLSNASGKYIILWGDDDIPFPYMIDYLIQTINYYPKIKLYHFNRMIGYDNQTKFNSLFLCDNQYEKAIKQYTLNEFLEKYFHEASFMSSIMFTKEAWDLGSQLDSSQYYGYEHLYPIFWGSRISNVLYISYPLCIQRKHKNRTWGEMWPQFGMIGIPNLLYQLESDGIINNANKIWNSRFNCLAQFIYNILWASSYKKKYYPLRKQICKYQTNYRRFIVYISLTILPSFIFKVAKTIYFNSKK